MTVPFGERIAEGFNNSFHGEPLWSGRSSFQKIDVYEHPHFGRVLTLDGLVQTTEGDEFCYHEMLVHPSLCARETMGRVLIVGGGDGGTLRHVLMHGPDEAVVCEIDEEVVRVSREYLPSISRSVFDDPRTRLVIGDGAAFVAEHEDAFDVIVVDSTDPVGAAVVLFSSEFYEACLRALRPGGILVSQTGSPLYQAAELGVARRTLDGVFSSVDTYVGFVPTYPGVLWSYTAATEGASPAAVTVEDIASRLETRGISPRYYTPEAHPAAFALPAFVREIVETASPTRVPGR